MQRGSAWLVAIVAASAGSLAACSVDEGEPSNAVFPEGGASSSGAGGGLLPNAANCTSSAQCQSNDCFIGGMQNFCTVPCTSDNVTTVCVAPFTGTCNKMGFCKRS